MPLPSKRGPTRTTRLRNLVGAVFCIAQSGCQWRLLPKDFPPFTAVQRHFYRRRDDVAWQAINHVQLMEVREVAGREASPSAGVIDIQSVKTTEGEAHAAARPKRWSRVASATSSRIRSGCPSA